MNKGRIPKNIGALLPSILLNRLDNRLGESDRLKSLWSRLIPLPLAARCLPVRYEGGCLYVQTESAAWASRLRHGQDDCLTRLRTEPYFASLKSLQIRVVPASAHDSMPKLPATQVKTAAVSLSTTARQTLRSAAEAITDPALRESLLRLSGDAPDAVEGRKR
jgi:hypothetical protein